MLLRGFADAIMMRTQQAIAFGGIEGYLPPHHYDQIFTAHGVIMIFFVAMPLRHRPHELRRAAADRRARRGLPVPEQFQLLDDGGRRRPGHGVAVRRRVRADRLARLSAAVGHRPTARASGSTTTSGRLQIAGVGTTLSGINLIATIVKMRAPGMTMMKMPVFTWTALCTNILIVADLPGADRDAGAAVARPLRRHATSSRTTSAATR